MRNLSLILLFSCFLFPLIAQESISGIINQYTAVTALGSCNNSVTVTNANGFEIGDQVILIQMKGAEINANDNADFGTISSMGNAGKYEKAVIAAVNSNTVEFEGTLLNEYTPSGKVQLVSMPIYEDVEVVGVLTALPWNGTTGGVLAFASTGTLVISADITTVGLGFRGGISETVPGNDCSWIFNQNNYFYDASNWRGAKKGEGIGELIAGKEAGRGPQANGGGGGNDHNSGGGGGSNISGGGQGGENDEPSTFGCDGEYPGLGGRTLMVDTSRIFLGGGGGAGHSNNSVGTNGGNGGGIIIIEGNIIQMDDDIEVDGRPAMDSPGDGAGGGGAGGTLVLYANDFLQSGLGGIATGGGYGGSTDNGNLERCFGPGGGGSGGRVITNVNIGVVPPTGGAAGKVVNSTASCNNSNLNATGGNNSVFVAALGIPTGGENTSLSILQQPTSQQACLGTDIVFGAQIMGTNLNYQWQVNTGSGFQNIIDGVAYDGTTTSSLTVFNLSSVQDGYLFRLAIDNPCTSLVLTDEVSIDVFDAPVITVQAQSASVCVGEVSIFALSANGLGLNYQWQKMEGGTWMNLSNDLVFNGVNTSTLTVDVDQGLSTGASFQCILIDDCGVEISSEIVQLNILTAASANFNFASNGLNLDFTNLSQNASSYQWNFGDTNSSIENNPSHTYAAEGTYSVQLIAFNADCGPDTFKVDIVLTLGMAPIANFSATPTATCAPGVIQFINNSSTNASDFQWSFPGGNPATSNMENPSVTYNSGGSYEVNLIVSNAAGSDMISFANYIVINDVPDPSFASGVLDLTVNFSNLTTNATSYEWSFGDGGVSTEVNPTYAYSAPGNYTVTLTAINECGMMTFTEMIEVNSALVANFTSNINSGCAPLTIQFTDNSTPLADTWDWTFLGGNPTTSTQQNPIVEYTTAGIYDVVLEVANQVGNNTISQMGFITVQDIPSASFSQIINGQTVDFTNLSTNGNTLTWDFGDNEMSNATNPSHTYTSPGTYAVDLIVENECGSDVFSTTIVIEETNTINASFSSNVIAACAPFIINYEDFSAGEVTTWNWSFPGGTPSSSTEQNPSIFYNDPGSYDVSLEVGNGITTDQIVLDDYLTLVVPPQADFDYILEGNALTMINNSENANFYEWNFGNGFDNSNEENPFNFFWETGVYTVSLFASNGLCGSIVAEDISIIVTSTHQLGNDLSVDLFPNPVNDLLQVKFSQIIEDDLVLKIWNSNGQLLQQQMLRANDVFEIDMSTYSSGLYLVQLLGDNTNLTERVVKK